MPDPADSARERAIEAARKIIGIETLEERGSDRLDFHDVSVVSLRRALEVVFNAGLKAGESPLVSVPVCLECGDRCMTILEDADSGGRCEGCRNSETEMSK